MTHALHSLAVALFVLISRTPGSAPANGNGRPVVQPASNNTSVATVSKDAMNGNYWPIGNSSVEMSSLVCFSSPSHTAITAH